MSAPVRAIVVDDSTTARALLVEILCAAGVEVVGEGADGADALTLVHDRSPSVVVMDIEMPKVDGFEATKAIMSSAPTPIVIVTGRHDPADVAVSLQATQVGALAVLPKPRGPGSQTFERDAARIASLVRALADVKVIGRRGSARAPRRPDLPDHVGEKRIRAIGVAASTGGPAAVYRFVAALPADLRAPVLVVQHIAEGFTPGLVRWLNTASSLSVRIAEEGARLSEGTVYVAPNGTHLEVDGRSFTRLSAGPPDSGFRPSASVLFRSMAAAYGAAVAAVVLTGMGTDGLSGVEEVRRNGGAALAQDEATSAVFGMPGAIIEAGLANFIGPVEELARHVARLTVTQSTVHKGSS